MRKTQLLTACVVFFLVAHSAHAQNAPVPGASFVHASEEAAGAATSDNSDEHTSDAEAVPGAEGASADGEDKAALSQPTEGVEEPLEASEEMPSATTKEPSLLDAAKRQQTSLPLVAVLDLRAGEAEKALASALVTVVTSELAARDDVRAVSRNELQAIVTHKAEQALLGCESVKCAADLGKLVEADLVVTGAIERAGEAYVFSLSLIDPVAGEVKERVEATWRSSPEEIVILVRPYVDRLLGGARAAEFVGALEVLAPDGADVFLGGKAMGTAPLKDPIADLPIGVHTLEVAKGGHVTFRRDVVISRGETTILRVELEEEPLLSQWWFWTAIGGGAAVAVAAGATVGTVALIAASEPPTTSLGVKANLPSAGAR